MREIIFKDDGRNIHQVNSGVNFAVTRSAVFELNQFEHYLRRAIEFVEQSVLAVELIRIPSIAEESKNRQKRAEEPEKVVFRFVSEKLGEQEAEKIKRELFEGPLYRVYRRIEDFGNWDKAIDVLDRNPEEQFLELEGDPDIESVYLEPNTYSLRKQINAIRTLRDKPLSGHQNLLQLFAGHEYAFRDPLPIYGVKDWKVLTNLEIEGTSEQREFVNKALASPDFALLEGPPGSGKTTTIIELILQAVMEGKRVLLCSSTHVAVDNVINRIVGKFQDVTRGKIVPMRVARRENDISDDLVKEFWQKRLIKKYKKQLRENLKNKNTLESQRYLRKTLDGGKEQRIDQLIFDSANLVAGTMIGILQHPEFKGEVSSQPFDLMIVDEASKVTFQEFIVPALYAKKWVLVGDVQQLSPYVEGDYVGENLNRLIPDEDQKRCLVDLYELQRRFLWKNWSHPVRILLSDHLDEGTINALEGRVVFDLDQQFDGNQSSILALNGADIVVGTPSQINQEILEDHLSVSAEFFGLIPNSDRITRQQNYFHGDRPYEFQPVQLWHELLASKLDQYYSFRRSGDRFKNIGEEVGLLTPETIAGSVEQIKRVAFPSILEVLQEGCDPFPGQRTPKIYTHGMAEFAKEFRFTSLAFQHRMHPDIAKTSQVHFYAKEGNLQPSEIVKNRPWDYCPEERRVAWVHNADRRGNQGGKIVNPTEVAQIRDELQEFRSFAEGEGDRKSPYEIAVLTYYRNQEWELRKMVAEAFGGRPWQGSFAAPNMVVKVCTVDRFQGQEADYVLLSFTKCSPNAHYNSINRLNVALTRARHKLLLFGNRAWFEKRAKLEALRFLAKEFPQRLSTRKYDVPISSARKRPYSKKRRNK